MTAALNHHKEFVEFLLQNGAEVNAKNIESKLIHKDKVSDRIVFEIALALK